MLQAIYDAIDPVAFSVGPLEVRWYGLAYVAAFIVCALVAYHVSKRWKMQISGDDMLTILLGVMIGVIVGARLGYVIIYGGDYYWEHPLQIFALSNGGMSFHGGLIGVIIAGLILSRILKVPMLSLADMVVVAVPIGLFFGRCANFINGELWGSPTDLPWGVVFEDAGDEPRHPSQLYEAFLEGIVLFLVLYLLARKKNPLPRGSYLSIFLILYGIFRILVEFVREPDVQLGYLYGGWLTMGMVLSVPLVIAGIILLVWSLNKGLPHERPATVPETAVQTGGSAGKE